MSLQVATKILEEVCAELGVRSQTEIELGSMIFGFTNAKEKEMMGKLRVFCQENSTFSLQTSNEIFSQKVKKAQELRFKAALERYRQNNPPEKFLITLVPDAEQNSLKNLEQKFGSWAIIDTNYLAGFFEQMHPRGVQNTEDEIHDLLKAYYEVI